MTSVGRRPRLDELLAILGALRVAGAVIMDLDNPEKPDIQVIIRFSRAQLEASAPDWVGENFKPTWLFEEIREQLLLWAKQCAREAQWVSKEERFGASIDTLMTYWAEELKKASEAKPENMLVRAQKQILSNTIVRLKELKERREAAAVYSGVESRREKARKTWEEDEYEAPKREEEQRRQQEARDGVYSDFRFGVDPEIRRQAEELFKRYTDRQWEGIFGDFFGFDHAQPKPPPSTSGNKRPWYEILGVAETATNSQVTKAYRRQLSRHHPDKLKANGLPESMKEEAKKKTQQIIEAYNLIREQRGIT